MASTTQTTAPATAGNRAVAGGRPAGRALASAVAGVAACSLIGYLAWRSGGYFPETHLPVGAAAFAVLAVLLVLRPPYWTISTPSLVAVLALAGLAIWTGLSAHWSSAPDTALEDFQRMLVYLGIFGLGLMASASGRYSRHMVWAVLGLGTVIVTVGLLSRLYPDVVSSAGLDSAFNEYRLAYPLSYWNAFGALGALVLVLAVGIASDPRTATALRAAAAGGAVPIGVAAYLSFSRGAWLAFFVGVAVLLAAAGHRRQLAATLAIVFVPLVLAILRLDGFPALTEQPPTVDAQSEAGEGYAPSLVLLALLAAATQAALAHAGTHARVAELGDRFTRLALYGAVVAFLVGGAGFYVFKSSSVEGGSARVLADTEAFFDRQWDEFMRPAQSAPAEERDSAAERLTTARGTRSDLYRVAIDGFEANPIAGDGSGAYEYRFAHDRDVDEKVRDAHSLYLETLGELGLVGIALLLTFLGAIVAALLRTRRRADPLSRAQAAAVAGAFAVWVAHAGVDWDWQLPGMTGVALLLATTAFPAGRRGIRRRSRKPR